MKKLGIITIGQSPRLDITSDLRQHLPADVALIEAGALDGLSRKYIEEKMRPNRKDVMYVSRMADGSEVKLAKNRLIPIMQKRIHQLERKEADLIVIFCTGDFPEFDAKVPLIYAGRVLKGLLSGLKCKQDIGILVPLRQQIDYARKKWGEFFENLKILHASPYTSTKSDFRIVAKKFKESGAKLVIMDCIGYTSEQKNILKEYSDLPVISSRSVLIRFLNELLE